MGTPLAEMMRPTELSHIIGQEHIVGEGKFLRRAIEANMMPSIIFYGPPGTGKTTISKVIANITKGLFVELNATTAGKSDITKAIQAAETAKEKEDKRTILFIDEIHRFNKAQQDALLPAVEKGIVSLIGATTENPYFEVNKALLSRCSILELKPLSCENIENIVKLSIYDKERGLGNYNVEIEQQAISFVAECVSGDARSALNAVELAVKTTKKNDKGIRYVTLETIQECIQRRVLNYDKDGDSHYDIVSAFIKSIRGSDPDAAIHYLARMIESGEDPKFIARRIVISASEDIGNADPNGLVVATSAMLAVERVGLPEGRIILAQAVTYLACAKKSNGAYKAIDEAIKDVRTIDIGTVPNHLKDAHYKSAGKLGHGAGYLYPHDYKDHYVEQQYLPDAIKNKKYYKL